MSDDAKPTRYPVAMVHGRFQPFHNGHLAYVREAHARCEELIIAVTNFDLSTVRPEALAPHRHMAEANPFSYLDRMRMMRAALEREMAPETLWFIPFPINRPELWEQHIRRDIVQVVRVGTPWEAEKADRFRAWGAPVDVIDVASLEHGGLSGSEVRRRIGTSGGWEELVPSGTREVVRELLRARSR